MKIRNMKVAAGVVFVSLLSSHVSAAVEPKGTKYDARIQYVMYNPDDVVVIRTRTGNSTLIQLEEGESLVNDPTVGLSIGDKAAWTIGVRGHNIFIKPKQPFPDTNINLVTNRRTYALSLVETNNINNASWQVRFNYPAVPVPYKEPVVDRGPCSDGPQNHSYFKYGDQELAPTQVWDDGRFTCFKFPTSKALPAIYRYAPGSDLKEALVNFNVRNDVIVVHETAHEFRLRIGKKVLGIKTDSLRDAPYNDRMTTTGETRVKLDAN